ncbi:MAG: YkgJ family cysteine cluster protein [Terracidiphilus sp.]
MRSASLDEAQFSALQAFGPAVSMRGGAKWGRKGIVDRSVILGGMRLPAGDSELVQIVDAALADAARRAGPRLVCRLGCTQCCYGAFAIGPLDALRLAAGMEELRSTEPELAAEIERRARAWIAEHGAEFPGDAETGRLGESDADQERFEEFAGDAACPALDLATGRCDVYAWRPMTCRVFGPPVRMESGDDGAALGHCELCFAGASESEVAACEMEVPHELEARLQEELGLEGETVVAFALLR